MSDKCEKCGGELIEGELASMHGIYFYPRGEISKIKPKRSPVTCNCCKQCGHIQDFRAENPEKLI